MYSFRYDGKSKYYIIIYAIIIYKSMLLSNFDYGDILYMFSSKNELDTLERLQERCINICTKTY